MSHNQVRDSSSSDGEDIARTKAHAAAVSQGELNWNTPYSFHLIDPRRLDYIPPEISMYLLQAQPTQPNFETSREETLLDQPNNKSREDRTPSKHHMDIQNELLRRILISGPGTARMLLEHNRISDR